MRETVPGHRYGLTRLDICSSVRWPDTSQLAEKKSIYEVGNDGVTRAVVPFVQHSNQRADGVYPRGTLV